MSYLEFRWNPRVYCSTYIILDNCQKLIILFLMWITYLCAAHLRISSLKSGSWDFIAHWGLRISEVAASELLLICNFKRFLQKPFKNFNIQILIHCDINQGIAVIFRFFCQKLIDIPLCFFRTPLQMHTAEWQRIYIISLMWDTWKNCNPGVWHKGNYINPPLSFRCMYLQCVEYDEYWENVSLFQKHTYLFRHYDSNLERFWSHRAKFEQILKIIISVAVNSQK